MEVSPEDEFWQAFLKKVKPEQIAAEEVRLRRELEQAEDLLREIETEGNADGDLDTIQQSQIDRWVARAISATPEATPEATADHDHADHEHADHEHDGPAALRATPPPEQPKARPWQAWLAAAAAFLATPKFLVAATVVAGIAVTGALLQRTTTTLPFENAVNILLDAEQPDAVREAAGGRVYFDVVESIQILNGLAEADVAMASSASDAIQQLLTELRQPIAFEPKHFEERLTGLVEQLLATDSDLAARQDSLDTLVEQVQYGLQALQSIAARHENNVVGANNALHLQRIESLLDR